MHVGVVVGELLIAAVLAWVTWHAYRSNAFAHLYEATSVVVNEKTLPSSIIDLQKAQQQHDETRKDANASMVASV